MPDKDKSSVSVKVKKGRCSKIISPQARIISSALDADGNAVYTFKGDRKVKVSPALEGKIIPQINEPHNQKYYGIMRNNDFVQADGWITNPNHAPRKWFVSLACPDYYDYHLKVWEPNFNVVRMERLYYKARLQKTNSISRFHSALLEAAKPLTEFYGWIDLTSIYNKPEENQPPQRQLRRIYLNEVKQLWCHDDEFSSEGINLDAIPPEMIQPKLALMYEQFIHSLVRKNRRLGLIAHLFRIAIDNKLADSAFRNFQPWHRPHHAKVLYFGKDTRKYVFRPSLTRYKTDGFFFELVLEPDMYQEYHF